MEDVFSEEDVPNILAIPIRSGMGWRTPLHGILILRGAFLSSWRIISDDEAQRRKQHQQGEGSNSQRDMPNDMIWKRI
jgi:hypothetical protein